MVVPLQVVAGCGTSRAHCPGHRDRDSRQSIGAQEAPSDANSEIYSHHGTHAVAYADAPSNAGRAAHANEPANPHAVSDAHGYAKPDAHPDSCGFEPGIRSSLARPHPAD